MQLDGKREWGRRFLYKIEPNFSLAYSTVVEGCQAGGLGHLFQNVREYDAESPKQDSKRFNSQVRGNTLPIWVYNLPIVWEKRERNFSTVCTPYEGDRLLFFVYVGLFKRKGSNLVFILK